MITNIQFAHKQNNFGSLLNDFEISFLSKTKYDFNNHLIFKPVNSNKENAIVQCATIVNKNLISPLNDIENNLMWLSYDFCHYFKNIMLGKHNSDFYIKSLSKIVYLKDNQYELLFSLESIPNENQYKQLSVKVLKDNQFIIAGKYRFYSNDRTSPVFITEKVNLSDAIIDYLHDLFKIKKGHLNQLFFDLFNNTIEMDKSKEMIVSLLDEIQDKLGVNWTNYKQQLDYLESSDLFQTDEIINLIKFAKFNDNLNQLLSLLHNNEKIKSLDLIVFPKFGGVVSHLCEDIFELISLKINEINQLIIENGYQNKPIQLIVFEQNNHWGLVNHYINRADCIYHVKLDMVKTNKNAINCNIDLKSLVESTVRDIRQPHNLTKMFSCGELD